MSTPEQSVEARSSVKLTLNAKGEVQIEVKACVGDTDLAATDAREIAIRQFEQTVLHFSTTKTPAAGSRAA